MPGIPGSIADRKNDNSKIENPKVFPRADRDRRHSRSGIGTPHRASPSLAPQSEVRFHLSSGAAESPTSASMTIAEFVEHKFIPEFVASKRSAGRDHFKAILKHLLSPEHVSRLFPSQPGNSRAKLATIPDWPFIGALPLSDVNSDTIHRVTSAALGHGYSIQTATHMRNVIRSVFSHAIRTGYYLLPNPAASVSLPRIEPKVDHSLNLEQLRAVLSMMVYPERELVLFTVLTNMTIVEVCGLQWKYVNLFSSTRIVEQEAIPPITVAVRKQSYRGVLSNVVKSRRKFVPVPRLLATRLLDLKQRKQFTGPDDFVLVSRNGNPIHPGNMAARRLKSIRTSLQIPVLAWSVFYKTRARLKSELGGRLYEQFDDVLPLPKWMSFPMHEAPPRRVV